MFWCKNLRNYLCNQGQVISQLLTCNSQGSLFWKYIVLQIPNQYESMLVCNVKENKSAESYRNEWGHKNVKIQQTQKSMDFPANNGCFQANPFMSERIVGWNERTKENTRAREQERVGGKSTAHFPFSSASRKAHELWMRASQQCENLIPDQTALGSPWSSPSPSPPTGFFNIATIHS